MVTISSHALQLYEGSSPWKRQILCLYKNHIILKRNTGYITLSVSFKYKILFTISTVRFCVSWHRNCVWNWCFIRKIYLKSCIELNLYATKAFKKAALLKVCKCVMWYWIVFIIFKCTIVHGLLYSHNKKKQHSVLNTPLWFRNGLPWVGIVKQNILF